MILSIYTIGNGDLLVEVFNAIATVFNSLNGPKGIAGILTMTHLAVMIGGGCAVLRFIGSRDIHQLMRWVGLYVLVTSLILYPKATVSIVDRIDMRPRMVDNVPLSLSIFASVTTRIGLGMAEMIEFVFNMPNDAQYNKTGMLMGARFVLASADFEITDPAFSATLDEFMQQCVFYDLLLNRYTINDLMHAPEPWEFIKNNTSVARAFPLNGQITICHEGAEKLDKIWTQKINDVASLYGGQFLGKNGVMKEGDNNEVIATLFSHLSDGYKLLTGISQTGASLLQKNLLKNAMSRALVHNSANSDASAALQAFEDSKTELQIRHTLDLTGRQAGYWLQQLKNTLEAVLYGSFIFVYFLSFLPFGLSILRNYLFGLFYLQTLAPLFAIVNFIATFYAESRSLLFNKDGVSMADMAGITQANADAMALAGYLSWIVALGGGVMLFRGLPAGLQSAAQYLGGVLQNADTHVVSDAISGNISVGNTSFENQSQFNTNANHFDTNMRYASGMTTLQTETGSTLSIAPSGREILNTTGSISNLPVSISVAESERSLASTQSQMSISSALNQMQSAGSHYSSGLKELDDFSRQSSHFEQSGSGWNETHSTGLSHSAQTVSQLMDSFAKEHHVNHETAFQLLGQVYGDLKVGIGPLMEKIIEPINKIELSASGGLSGSASLSYRRSWGELYNQAERFSQDHHFSDAVDTARRDAEESHYRTQDDKGNRFAHSIGRSFDEGDAFRIEASSHLSKAKSYSEMASESIENASSINANETQPFYEWVRQQPSKNGSRTMSPKTVDEMSVHDMQSYANQFSYKQAAQRLHAFEAQNHLNQGPSAITAEYINNNTTLLGEAGVRTADRQYKYMVRDEMDSVYTGHVNKSIQGKIEKNIVQHQFIYEHQKSDDDMKQADIKKETMDKL